MRQIFKISDFLRVHQLSSDDFLAILGYFGYERVSMITDLPLTDQQNWLLARGSGKR